MQIPQMQLDLTDCYTKRGRIALNFEFMVLLFGVSNVDGVNFTLNYWFTYVHSFAHDWFIIDHLGL